METNCCTINVSELEDGFRIEIKGEGVKEKCQDTMAKCCSAEELKKCVQFFCDSGKDKTKCC